MNYSVAISNGDIHPAYYYAVGWGIFILLARLIHMFFWAQQLAQIPSSGGFWKSFKRLFHPPTKQDKSAEHYNALLKALEEGFFFNYLAVFSMVAAFMLGAKFG